MAELQELFLWKDLGQIVEELDQGELLEEAEREIADVLIYALLFCESIEADPGRLVIDKLRENVDKYPVDQARGSSNKYTEFIEEE